MNNPRQLLAVDPDLWWMVKRLEEKNMKKLKCLISRRKPINELPENGCFNCDTVSYIRKSGPWGSVLCPILLSEDATVVIKDNKVTAFIILVSGDKWIDLEPLIERQPTIELYSLTFRMGHYEFSLIDLKAHLQYEPQVRMHEDHTKRGFSLRINSYSKLTSKLK